LLREEEKIGLWEMAAKYSASGKILIADASAEGVEVSVQLAKRAAASGFHAVICGVPHHYRTMMYGPETQLLYFRSVADRSPIPVMIENAPAYTGVDVTPETSAMLSLHPNIIGVVETGTPAGRIPQIRQSAEGGFNVLAGSSTSLWESLEQGATGALLPLASAVPYACITLWEAFRMRDEAAGIDWQGKVSHPGILVTDLYGVPALKYAMELNGYYGGPPRLPYCPPDARTRAEIEKAFQDLRG
jgi:4-hydroxy-2-oxoglutarate aldolase